MRITSAAGKDCWRENFMISPEIKLDGRKQVDVIEADDVVGYVVKATRNEFGRLVRDGETLATERLSGRVEIIGVQR